MAKVTVIGSLEAREGRADEMARVLAAMVAAAGDEPGVEVYSYHRGEGNTFWFFALMADRDALEGHGRTPAMAEAMAAFSELAAGPPEMHVAAPVAAVGLDL